MEQPLVSIVIPVYNAEKYLTDCLNSIIIQTYKNIEIILVNDGSTDNSYEICNSFAKKNKNVKCINKKNEGPSMARNIGIDYSSGEYLMFVDSDDTIKKDMVEKMLNTVLKYKVDLVLCGVEKNFYKKGNLMNTKNTHFDNKIIKNKKEVIQYFFPLFDSKGLNSIWNKIYLMDIVKSNKIKFNKKLHMGEDYLFNLFYLKNINSVYILEENLYKYRIEYNILTNKFEENLFENRMIIYTETIKVLNEYKINYDNKVLDNLYIKFFYSQLMMLVHKKCNYSKIKKYEIIETMIENDKTQEILAKKNRKFDRYAIMILILKTKNKKILLATAKILKYIIDNKKWR